MTNARMNQPNSARYKMASDLQSQAWNAMKSSDPTVVAAAKRVVKACWAKQTASESDLALVASYRR